MVLRDCMRAVLARWRHPAMALAVFAIPVLLSVSPLRLSTPGSLGDLPRMRMALGIGTYWVLSLLFIAFPMQWTGDDRPQAGALRGLAQWAAFQIPLLVLVILLGSRGLVGRQTGLFAGMVLGLGLSMLPFLAIASWVIAKGETMAQEVREAERKALAAQQLAHRGSFSPRLLFESLQGLLQESDPATLERGLVDLAVLFRSQLVAQQKDRVPFGEERALVDLLLSLLARSATLPQTFSAQWDPAVDGCAFPSLALVKSLEAAARHPLQAGQLETHVFSRSVPGGLEAGLRWQGPDAEGLARALAFSPEAEAIRHSLARQRSLREPLTLSGSDTHWELVLRVTEGLP